MISMAHSSLDFGSPMQFGSSCVRIGANLAICMAYCIRFTTWRTRLSMAPAAFSEAGTV